MYKSTLPQNTVKLTRIQQNPQSLAYCPTTGREVRGSGQATFLIPGGQANWWHCPACQGWHILIVDHNNPLSVYNLSMSPQRQL